MKKQNYFEPAIEVIEMAVESGIAASPQLPEPDMGGGEWGDEI